MDTTTVLQIARRYAAVYSWGRSQSWLDTWRRGSTDTAGLVPWCHFACGDACRRLCNRDAPARLAMSATLRSEKRFYWSAASDATVTVLSSEQSDFGTCLLQSRHCWCFDFNIPEWTESRIRGQRCIRPRHATQKASLYASACQLTRRRRDICGHRKARGHLEPMACLPRLVPPWTAESQGTTWDVDASQRRFA